MNRGNKSTLDGSPKTYGKSFSEEPLPCNLCDFKTNVIETLRKHKAQHGQNNKNQKSRNGFWTPKFDGRNMDNKLTPISKCSKCGENFYHNDEVKLHMEYFHLDATRPGSKSQ